MKYLLFILLLFAFPVMADVPENGLFYDPDRNGEGINIYTRDDKVQFTLYTYIQRCRYPHYDDEYLIVDENYYWCRKQQAWFFTGAHPIDDGEAVGILFLGNPYDDVDFTDLEEFLDVGVFFLKKTQTGYRLRVVCDSQALRKQADICQRTFDFNTYLYGPTHPVVED